MIARATTVLALVCMLATAAQAVTLTSPPLTPTPLRPSDLRCAIYNRGRSSQEIRVEVLGYLGDRWVKDLDEEWVPPLREGPSSE